MKTYPEISRKYTETVCTAGIVADSKTFVRLYPIRFRYLEGKMQFKKYQWIRADITKATSDPRHSHYIREYGQPPADFFYIRLFLAAETTGATNAAIQLNRNNMLYF